MLEQTLPVFLASLLCVHGAIAVVETYYAVLPAYIITGDWDTLHGVDNAILCCLVCTKRTDCVAVNYHKGEYVCELIENGDVSTMPELEAAPDWDLYYTDLSHLERISIATAVQSSNMWGSFFAHNAIDGARNSYISGSNHCAHTSMGSGQWWLVDVKIPLPVTGVIIWNRLDCCSVRLHSLLLTVSPTVDGIDDPDSVCASYPGPPSPLGSNPVVIHCDRVMWGRFLKIAKHHNEGYLTLCEVELIVA